MIKQVLNYVWINKQPLGHSKSGELEGELLPDKYVANVVKLALMYPQTEFILWTDANLMTALGIVRLRDVFSAQNGLSNISVRDLNEIPGYKDEPFFTALSDADVDVPSNSGYALIWRKVDLARIIVLDYMLSTKDDAIIFYCDLDIIDPQISSPRVHELLVQNGLVFARTDRNGLAVGYGLENQFIGVNQNGRSFITNHLLPATRQSTIERGGSGWEPLKRCVREKFPRARLYDVSVMTRELGGPDPGSTHAAFMKARGIRHAEGAKKPTNCACIDPCDFLWGEQDIADALEAIDRGSEL